MNVEGFKVYYTDGSSISSNDYSWDELPESGVQVVVFYYEEEHAPGKPYRYLMSGLDEYAPFGWKPKYGAYMKTDDFYRLLDMAFEDEVL